MGFLYKTMIEFINEKTHLSYDEMDLDPFTNRYIVGRYFESEEEAIEYLESIISKSDKSIEDFMVIKEEGNTLKPYRIYPKPSDDEVRRNEASKFIKQYGILSSKDLRYITHPLYAYIEYKYIDRIKELGVSYRFKPLSEIDMNGPLSRYLKERGYNNNITGKKLSFFSYVPFDVVDENSITEEEVNEMRERSQELLNDFNNIIGTDYFISDVELEETNSSLKRSLNNTLRDDVYPSSEHNKKYRRVFFIMERGYDEEEFLAIVDMESIDKPKMK